MNKRQLIVMWLGIAVFVFLAFNTQTRFGGGYKSTRYTDYGPLVTRLLSTSIITAALVYTLKDRNRKGTSEKKIKNWNEGFRRLTVFLSITAATIVAVILIILFIDGLLADQTPASEAGDIFDKIAGKEFGIIESLKQAGVAKLSFCLLCLIFFPLGAYSLVWVLYYLLRWFALGFASEKKGCEKR